MQRFYTAVCVEQVFEGQLFVGVCFVVDISDIKHIHSPFKLRAIWISSGLGTVSPVSARYCSDTVGILQVGHKFVSEGVDIVLWRLTLLQFCVLRASGSYAMRTGPSSGIQGP